MTEIDTQRREPLVDIVGFRLSWGAIFAGFVVATVTQIVFSLLGIAIGFSVWNPTSGGAKGVGIGAAIWLAVSAIVSLFLGGLVLGRLAGILKTKDGVLHGIVMWGLTTLLAVWMVANGAGAFVGTTFNTLTRATGAVVSGAVAATGSAGAALANRPADASAVPQRLENAYDSVRSDVRSQLSRLPSTDSIAERGGEIVDQATIVVATTAWLTLLVMALSLGAAMWGSALTARK